MVKIEQNAKAHIIMKFDKKKARKRAEDFLREIAIISGAPGTVREHLGMEELEIVRLACAVVLENGTHDMALANDDNLRSDFCSKSSTGTGISEEAAGQIYDIACLMASELNIEDILILIQRIM